MMFAVIEILNDDDTSVDADDDEFEVETLGHMARDHAAGGYVTLDGTNYVTPVRIVGILREVNAATPGKRYRIDEIKDPS
jgi:hypothetical protein